MEQSRVILATSAMSQGLRNYGVKKSDIVYTIVDEASQIPENNVLQTISKATKKLILIGDNKQLSPVILSNQSKALGYGSFFEKLIELENAESSMLNECYRCHPKTTQIFSECFYSGKVKAGVTASQRKMSSKIPRDLAFDKTHSVFFHSIKKFENRKSDGYCNYEESNKIAMHISRMERNRIPASEIGVICTYKMQLFVMKSAIKKKVSLKYYNDLKIDTVDAFQGSEMEYIFLSLVRSNSRNDTGFVIFI